MTKYIWLTIILIVFIATLAYKQAPNEPEVERPLQDTLEDLVSEVPQAEEGEPVVSESGNIKVTRPQPGSTITSPLLIKGEARVFENTFQMRLKDANGAIITEKFGTADSPDTGEFGSFGELLLFDDVTADSGVLEVYSESAFDGSEQDLVSIPVNFN